MLIVERHQKLLEILRRQRAAQLDDLAREVGVSPSTVRRDLETLERQHLVQRTHGGAVYTADQEEQPSSIALVARMREHVSEKLAIGAYAASLVQPQMTVLLDGGSTVIFAARQITARPIQVLTNSLSIANLFKDDDQVELLFIGGSLYPRTEVMVGPIASGTLADLHADLLLFSLAGVYGQEAFNYNLSMARIEQVMMQQATQRVLLMDSSKFGRKSLVRVCGLDEVDQIITDAGITRDWQEQLGDRLVIASPVGQPQN
jgi:DeoR/GlpR family transcriptional regulator of sugar metabolism